MKEIVQKISKEFDYEWEAIQSFLNVETGGFGFSPATGKIIIQFEPVWFRRKQPFAPSGKWSVNKVDVQTKEWEAFNNAFSINKDSAMESTSIGIGQVMGGHWKRLGYTSAGAMWDDAKKGIESQIWQVCQFIKTDIKLQSCIKAHDWDGVATIYNGTGFRYMAKKYNRTPYDVSMKIEYSKIKQAA